MEKTIFIDGKSFLFDFSEDTDISFSLVERREGISVYRLFFKWPEAHSPKQITLTYEIPCRNTYYVWDPIEKKRSIPFGRSQVTDSRLGSGMPLKALVSRESKNAHTISVSDVKTPIALTMASFKFYEGIIKIGVELFTSLTDARDTYETFIRIDERQVDLDDVLYGARDWFDSLGYTNSHIPSEATLPMYSTWYSYGQDVCADDVVKECEVAAGLGMKAVILDDGWQLDGDGKIYGFCGDWNPVERKFPDMKGLSQKIHDLGMKIMLWYSVPFIGFYSNNYKHFEGKYLRPFERANCAVLDPRYKEVRDFLIETYVTAVKEWELDGLKLDFIDRFYTNGEYNEQMDYVSVEDAVECLLKDISSALKEINPDILIEFRQPYFGPVVSTYGNMIRVWDCPLDGCTNKNQTINLRLVSGNCAVHSDMICWHNTDTRESVALQLWGTALSVPQISVRLNDISDEHTTVLKNYLDFWVKHRSLLMDGTLKTKLSENGYGYASATLSEECFAMLSAGNVFEIPSDASACYVVNICGDNSVIVKSDGRKYLAITYDCLGNKLSETKSAESLCELELSMGGRIEIFVSEN